jgi:hypothetical protein
MGKTTLCKIAHIAKIFWGDEMTTTHHNRWSDADIAQLILLASQGNGDHAIGRIMGKTYWSVRSARQNRNIILTPRDGFNWTEERITELKSLWIDAKLPASRIAQIFSEKYDHPLTRNSIIGKVDRLKIGRPNSDAAGRGHHGPRLYGTYKPRKPRQKREKETGQFLRLVWSTPLLGQQISFIDLAENHCRFVIGNPSGRETMFCGSPKQQGSYCGYHHQLTHRNDAATPRPHRVGADAGSPPERVNGVGSILPDLPGAA